MIQYLPPLLVLYAHMTLKKINKKSTNQLNRNEHCKAALHAMESVHLRFGDVV